MVNSQSRAAKILSSMNPRTTIQTARTTVQTTPADGTGTGTATTVKTIMADQKKAIMKRKKKHRSQVENQKPKTHRTVLMEHRLKNLQNLKTAVTTLKKRKMTLHKIYFKGSKSPIGDLALFHCSSFNFLFIRLRPSLQSSKRGHVSHFGVLARQWYRPKKISWCCALLHLSFGLFFISVSSTFVTLSCVLSMLSLLMTMSSCVY